MSSASGSGARSSAGPRRSRAPPNRSLPSPRARPTAVSFRPRWVRVRAGAGAACRRRRPARLAPERGPAPSRPVTPLVCFRGSAGAPRDRGCPRERAADPVPLQQGVQRDAQSCSQRRQQRRGVAGVRNLQGREHRGDAQREGGRGQRAPIREPGRSQPEAGPAERRREDRAEIEGSALARRVRADTARLYLKGARGRLRIRWRSAYGAAVARSRGAACATWSQSSARTRAAGSPR